MNASPATNPFGGQLRHWRKARGLSQLTLALEAGTTPRHLSFLETGRSRPGTDIVLRLAEVLAIPRRERNLLLLAAGLPPAYADHDLAAPDLAPFRAVLDRMLAAHAPFPGFVFDRRWNIVATSPAGEMLLTSGPERNMVRLLFAPDGAWRELVDNWDHLAAHALAHLQDDVLRFPNDEVLRELLELAADAIATAGAAADQPASPSAHPRLRIGTEVIDTITVVARFGTPRDALLEELRLELVHPADAHAASVLRRLDCRTEPLEPDTAATRR